MKEQNVIEFEGAEIKLSKKDVYYCPFNCGNSSYPMPKWKTKQGIMKHLLSCRNRPSNLKRIEENKEVEEIIFNGLKKSALEMVTQKLGEKIYWIKKILVKDTHEQRGNRIVGVRYEQVLRFEAVESLINSIDFISINNYAPSVDYILKNCIYFNGNIPIANLRSDFETAKKDAEESTKKDEEHRKESSMYR